MTTAPLLALAAIATYQVLEHHYTDYFVTDKKMYKLFGIGFRKVVSAKKEEIDDLIVIQGLAEKIFFKTGTIKFNTPGSITYEVVFSWVASPFKRQKQIHDLWEKYR